MVRWEELRREECEDVWCGREERSVGGRSIDVVIKNEVSDCGQKICFCFSVEVAVAVDVGEFVDLSLLQKKEKKEGKALNFSGTARLCTSLPEPP